MSEEAPPEVGTEVAAEPDVVGEAEEHTIDEERNEEEELEEEEEEEAEEESQIEQAEEEKTVQHEIEEEEEGEEEEEEATTKATERVEEEIEEEYEEEPPDPTAPYDFTDSKEALKAPFELNAKQMAEVEAVWNLYVDHTPAYSDIDNYVTQIELEYMLKCLLLMTFTPEQLQELITFCVRRPDAEGTILFDEFVKMVTLRQRDMPIEEELRLAVEVLDPKKTGIIDREVLRETIETRGYTMNAAIVNNFIKEVDMTNDGSIGVEDVVGTMCLDLARDDIITLQNQINPPEVFDEHIADNLI